MSGSLNPFNYQFGEIRKAASAGGSVVIAAFTTYLSTGADNPAILYSGVLVGIVTFLVTFLVPQYSLQPAADTGNDVPLNTWEQPPLSLGLLDPTDEEEVQPVTEPTPDPFGVAEAPPES